MLAWSKMSSDPHHGRQVEAGFSGEPEISRRR